jgi:hypothetical protein
MIIDDFIRFRNRLLVFEVKFGYNGTYERQYLGVWLFKFNDINEIVIAK